MIAALARVGEMRLGGARDTDQQSAGERGETGSAAHAAKPRADARK